MTNFVTTNTASGQGSIVTPSGDPSGMVEISAKIITPADGAVFAGISPVRRVWKQAWYGVGFTANVDGVDTVILTWHRYLKAECEDFLQASWFAWASHLYYDVAPGGVMYFEMDWP